MGVLNTNTVQNSAATRTLISSSGNIVQIQHKQITEWWTGFSPSGYFQITPLSLSITPTSSSSRILVDFSFQGGGSGSWDRVEWRLYRNGSAISGALGSASGSAGTATGKWHYPGSANNGLTAAMGIVYLDSPATTSRIDYSVYVIDGNNDSGTFTLNRGAGDINTDSETSLPSSITLYEIT